MSQWLLDAVDRDGLDMWNVSSLMIGCQHADIVVENVMGRGRGRPRKTWQECVEEDMSKLKLNVKDDSDTHMIVRYGGMAFWETV